MQTMLIAISGLFWCGVSYGTDSINDGSMVFTLDDFQEWMKQLKQSMGNEAAEWHFCNPKRMDHITVSGQQNLPYSIGNQVVGQSYQIGGSKRRNHHTLINGDFSRDLI